MNSVSLLGRLARDPESKQLAGGNSLCNFTVAVDQWDAQSKENKAIFVRCVAFGKQGEFLAKYGSKGGHVALEGRLNVREYEDKNGQRVTATEVVAARVELPAAKRQEQQQGTEGIW